MVDSTLGIWERIHNLDFNCGEFVIIKSRAGLNSYKISVKEWVAKTNAIRENLTRHPMVDRKVIWATSCCPINANFRGTQYCHHFQV